MEVMAAIVGALVAAIVTYFVSNRDLSDSLDSKSGWREKLFTVASKYELTLDGAQTVRAALRIFPKDEQVEQYSFTWFSNIMIVHLDKYILNGRYKSKVTVGSEIRPTQKNIKTKIKNFSFLESEEWTREDNHRLNEANTDFVRLFAMFLLKYHFDYRSSMGAKDYLFLQKIDRNKKYNPFIKETYEQYERLIERSKNVSTN